MQHLGVHRSAGDRQGDGRQHQAGQALAAGGRKPAQRESEHLEQQQAHPEHRHREAQRGQARQCNLQWTPLQVGGQAGKADTRQQRQGNGGTGQGQGLRQALGQQCRDRSAQRQRLAKVAVQGPPQQVEILLEQAFVQPVVSACFGQVLRRQAVGFHAGGAQHDRQGIAGQQVEDEVGDGISPPQHQQGLADAADQVASHGWPTWMSLSRAKPSAVQWKCLTRGAVAACQTRSYSGNADASSTSRSCSWP
ncbi:hypothetical protein D9M71_557420 [compost metagenome]